MSYFLYILRCDNNYLYVGIAKDVKARFALHQSGKGAKFTKINRPLKIVYSKKIGSLSRALKKEAEVKKLSRPQKEEMILELADPEHKIFKKPRTPGK